MNNLDLKKFGVQELNAKEMVDLNGGRKIPWKAIGDFFTLLGIYDAIEEFKEGWNSVDCGCKK